MSELWKLGSSEVRLSRAEELDGGHHLQDLWRCGTYGTVRPSPSHSMSPANSRSDCMQRPGRPGFGMPPGAPGFMPNPNAPMDQARAQQFDSEYASLMAELGETSATAPLAAAGTETVDPVALAQWQAMQPPPQPLDENGEKIPPWRIPGNWYVILTRYLPPP